MSYSSPQELALIIQSGWRVIALETFEEDRALKLLQRVGESCKREVVRWTAAAGFENGRGAGSLDAGLQAIAAHTGPALFAIFDPAPGLADPLTVRRMRDLLPVLSERSQTLVLIGPIVELPTELQREVATLELPLPGVEELTPVFARAAEGADSEVIGRAVRAALGLTGAEAVRVLRKVCSVTGGLNEEAVSMVVREKRQMLRRTAALSFHEVDTGLSDVGGLGELKRWLRERKRAFGEEARNFGLPVPRGLLLLGVQGCGKSLSAKSVAREWQFPLLRLDLAATFGGGDSSPEATIREATAIAESIAPAVLWIDEIEKGFAASDADPRASRVFGSFLTWLSEKESAVFVVATANDIENLPPELLRRGRFDELFFVDLPNVDEREEILAIHLRRRGRDPMQLPIRALAEQAERLSGSELEQVVGAALYTAFAQDREIEPNDLANAIVETVPLYDTFEERIKELRDWARTRARPATIDAKMVDLFSSSSFDSD